MRQMPFLSVVGFIMAFSLLGPVAVLAQDAPPPGPLVTAQLIAEQDGVVPGKNFSIAVRQTITTGWHTYWKNPGDTGLASDVKWDTASGATFGALQFPTPQRHRMGDLLNYGYEDTVTIIAEVTPPAGLKAGDNVTLTGTASWLVCKDVCIPEKQEVTLTLPVVETAASGPWASAFEAVRKTLPQPHNATMTAAVDAAAKTLVVTLDPLPLPSDSLPDEAYFFPDDGLLILHNAEQKMVVEGRKLTLTIPLNTTRSVPIDTVSGDMWFRTARGTESFAFTATVKEPALAPVAAAAAPVEKAPTAPTNRMEKSETFIGAIIAAFLGGLILNLMPCVFPVLSLKALALVKKSQSESRREVRLGGMFYLAGILSCFALLGVILTVLRASGQQIGWGIQLQSPIFVASMAVLLFGIGYVLSGAVTIGGSLMGVGSKLATKEGHKGAFFTGALAVIVATPCTAPFMGGAVFYALTQPAFVTVLVLMAMGVGLALPYVVLTWYPTLLKALPKPGIWMEHFKQFLAFPMLAAAVWLVWVLAQQNGATGVLMVLSSMLALAFGAWLYQTTAHRKNTAWQMTKKFVALLALGLAVFLVLQQPKAGSVQTATVTGTADAPSEPWSPERLAALRAEQRPVLVNMTAAWCITCLANEKAALGTDKVTTYLREKNVVYLKGDWTNYDPAITEYLKQFGRSGVPLYVFYPGDENQEPVVLPQLLTPQVVIDALQPTLGE